MKTSEFIAYLDNKGLYYKIYKDRILIHSFARVWENSQYLDILSSTEASLNMYDDSEDYEILQTIIEYARTPLNKRRGYES